MAAPAQKERCLDSVHLHQESAVIEYAQTVFYIGLDSCADMPYSIAGTRYKALP